MHSKSDITCVAGKDWPSSWSVRNTSLMGLGMANNVAKSTRILNWNDGEDYSLAICLVHASLNPLGERHSGADGISLYEN